MIRRHFLAFASSLPAWAAETPAILRVRVIDGATGGLIPATVRIRTSSGKIINKPEPPTTGFRSSGKFEKQLPPGKTLLQISRGFDYGSAEEELDLRAGEERSLTVTLNRRTPLHAEGWRCGDSHVHMIHGESRIAVDFEYLSLAARAEALDYMSVAQRWKLPEQSAEAAEAECARVSQPDCTLTWNMEAPKNYFRGNVTHCLGHCWFIGARPRDPEGRDVAQVLSALSAGDYQSDKTPTPNFESHALIRAQGGFLSYTHPSRWWWGKWGGRGIYPVEERKFVSNMAQELPFDTIAGPTYDGLDILMQTHEKEVNANGLQLWFLLLNQGYRLSATACTDATFDNPGRGVPGKVRVYTRTSGPFSIPSLVAAMKASRNFVTSGPLVAFEIEGHQPGHIFEKEAATTTMSARLRAWAAPHSALSEIELIRNGVPIRRMAARDGYFETTFDLPLEGDRGWIIARCFGRDRDHEVAITNPFYWAPPGWRTPRPVPAQVTVAVTGPEGSPLNGECTVFERIGLAERTLSTHPVTDGKARFAAPATARVRIQVQGFAPTSRSLFLDTPQLLEPTLNMRPEQLLSWGTFEKLAAALGDVRLEVTLPRG